MSPFEFQLAQFFLVPLTLIARPEFGRVVDLDNVDPRDGVRRGDVFNANF